MTATWHIADQQQQSYVTVSATPTVNKPTNLAEDELVGIFLATNNDDAISVVPDGFTLRHSAGPTGSLRPRIHFYTKVATASEPATYDFTLAAAMGWHLLTGRITGYRLVGGTPVDQVSAPFTSDSVLDADIASITPSEADTLMLGGATYRSSASAVDHPASMTELLDTLQNPSTSIALEVLDTANPTGTRTFTLTDVTARRAAGLTLNIFSAEAASASLPKIGASDIGACFTGVSEISRLYVGTNLVADFA